MKFAKACRTLSIRAGSWKTFLAAVALISAWALTGPFFHFNDTWQLIINTSTTVITFLMVFLIQNTQNRDNEILHLKIDELSQQGRTKCHLVPGQAWDPRSGKAA
jgi:low affinity Fe/Cu permease